MVFRLERHLKFVSNSIWFSLNLHSKLSTCTCQTHAKLNQINYTETAFYNRKLARLHFDCSQACCEEELNLRLKGGHCERQKLTFHFIFPVLHVVLNKHCQRQTGVFTVLHLCRVLLRDAVRCSAARKPRNNMKGHYAYRKCDGGFDTSFHVLG